jgi:alkaline phosphatase
LCHKKGTAVALSVLLAAGLTAAPAHADTASTSDQTAAVIAAIKPISDVKNVILFIGDGMGDSQIALARDYIYGAKGSFPGIDALPFTGAYTTFSVHASTGLPDYTTDSAASATGWTTGVKSYDGAIAVDRFGAPHQTLTEAAKAAGLATGVITTDEVQGATPAAELAHVTSRGCTGPASNPCGGLSISEQILDTKADVVIGGGKGYFDQVITSGADAGKSVTQAAADRGFNVVTTEAGLRAVTAANQSQPLLALLSSGVMPTRWVNTPSYAGGSSAAPVTCQQQPNPRISLSEMTMKSVDLLKANPNGFFLQVEGASIDKQSHAFEPCGQIGETDDLDQAVKAALDYAKADGHTLVILTADHGHSSTISAGPVADVNSLALAGKDGTIYASYNSGSSPTASQQHSGTQLRLAAYGPGAAYVTGVTDQTDLHATIRKALKLPAVAVAANATVDQPGGAYRITGDPVAELKAAAIPADQARNVILITAPGIGDTEITLARDYRYGAHGKLPGIDALPFTGELKPYGTTSSGKTDDVPDATAALAALLSGVPFTDGVSATDYKGRKVSTVLTEFGGRTQKLTGKTIYSPSVATVGGFANPGVKCSALPGWASMGTATTAAIKELRADPVPSLKKNDQPFLLHVNISAASYANKADACGVIGAALNADLAVQAALKFAAKRTDTLVIFTGGVGAATQVIDGTPFAAPSLRLTTYEGADLGMLFAPAAASGPAGSRLAGTQVFVGAFGPGAANLMGVHDATAVAQVVRLALKLEGPLLKWPTTTTAKLAKATVKTTAKAKVKVTVKPVAKNPKGTIKVAVSKAGFTKTIKATLKAANKGKTTVVLPKLKKGKYKISVKFAGSAKFANSAVTGVKLTVK